jgi:hypothetical protein
LSRETHLDFWRFFKIFSRDEKIFSRDEKIFPSLEKFYRDIFLPKKSSKITLNLFLLNFYYFFKR